jgi:ankyrin repeat protein
MQGQHWIESGLLALAMTVVGSAASGDLRLIDAVKHRDPNTAKLLVAQHADVNAAQPDGATALAWAAFIDDRETAEILLSAGAKVNTADQYGETPLTLAAANGDAVLVRELLQAGADPSAAQWNHETALMKAANSGSVEAVQLLIDKGAAVNVAESAKGQTALMWAAAEGHSDVVKALIDHGADIKAASKAGFNALVFSMLKDDVKSMGYELKAGADPNYALPSGSKILAMAAAGQHQAAASILIEGGADYKLADKTGNALIHIASQAGDPELVKELLAKGVDPNLPTAKQGEPADTGRGGGGGGGRGRGVPGQMTPLMVATRYGHEDIMRLLTASGANPKLTAQDHTTLLMLAANSGKLPVVKYAYELDPTTAKALNDGGANAVHASVSGGGPSTHEAHHEIAEVIEFLWSKGTDVDMKNGQGRTAIEMSDRLPIDQAVDKITELLQKDGRKPIVPTERK